MEYRCCFTLTTSEKQAEQNEKPTTILEYITEVRAQGKLRPEFRDTDRQTRGVTTYRESPVPTAAGPGAGVEKLSRNG